MSRSVRGSSGITIGSKLLFFSFVMFVVAAADDAVDAGEAGSGDDPALLLLLLLLLPVIGLSALHILIDCVVGFSFGKQDTSGGGEE